MRVEGINSVILYVKDLNISKSFYVDLLGLPILFEDNVIVVTGNRSINIVLHRNDCSHDERGIFPAGTNAGAVSLRFNVENPGEWESELTRKGIKVIWPTQEATWGRFLLIEDPDGRPIVLAKMTLYQP